MSAFIGEKGYKKGTSQLINTNKGPDATSELGSVVVPNSSIPQTPQNSNIFDENISEDATNLSKNENSAEKVGTETEDRAENVREGAKDAAENVTETAENVAEATEDKYSAIGIGIWARENVSGYGELSEQSRKFLYHYRKLFKELEARNRGNNALSRALETTPGKEKTVTSMNDENMQVTERAAVEIAEGNKPFVVVDQDILNGVAEKDWIKTVKDNLSSKFPNGIVIGNNVISIDAQSRKEMTFSKYMQWLRKNNPQAFSDKLRATNNADEILNATQNWINEGLNHPRQDGITDFARGDVLLRIGANDYSASVVVGTRANGKMKLYDILNLVPTKIIKKETSEAIPANSSRRTERKTSPISTNIIPQNQKKSTLSGEKSQMGAALYQNPTKMLQSRARPRLSIPTRLR